MFTSIILHNGWVPLNLILFNRDFLLSVKIDRKSYKYYVLKYSIFIYGIFGIANSDEENSRGIFIQHTEGGLLNLFGDSFNSVKVHTNPLP